MANEPSQDIWRTTMARWLISAAFAPIKIMGARQVKVMTRGMSLYFVSSLLKEFAPQGKDAGNGDDNDESAFNLFKKVEAESGLFNEEQTANLEQTPEGSSKFTFSKCPYGSACNTIIPELLGTGEFNKSSVPCFRCDTYSAAAALLNRSRRQYRLIQIAPGVKCSGELLKSRTSRTSGQ